MARVHRITKSAKAHTCEVGGHPIPKGDPYLYAAPGFRAPNRYRCTAHPFRGSDLVSGLRSEPLAAIEAFEDAAGQGFESIDDLRSAWEDLATALQEYVDVRQEGLDAWEYGNSTLEELLDQAQAALDEVEGWEPEEYGEPEPDEFDEGAEYDSDEEREQAQSDLEAEREEWEQAVADHLAEQTDEALSIAGSLDV